MLFYGIADNTRENAETSPGKESILWRGFFSAMPAKTKCKSVTFTNAWPRSKASSRGWMRKTCFRGIGFVSMHRRHVLPRFFLRHFDKQRQLIRRVDKIGEEAEGMDGKDSGLFCGVVSLQTDVGGALPPAGARASPRHSSSAYP
jgi:hypothetical protein